MKTVVNVLFVVAPEAAVLMPNERFLLSRLEATIGEDIAHPSDGIVFRAHIPEAELLRQLKNLFPNSL